MRKSQPLHCLICGSNQVIKIMKERGIALQVWFSNPMAGMGPLFRPILSVPGPASRAVKIFQIIENQLLIKIGGQGPMKPIIKLCRDRNYHRNLIFNDIGPGGRAAVFKILLPRLILQGSGGGFQTSVLKAATPASGRTGVLYPNVLPIQVEGTR